eukprot:scaffold85340_cov69-Phaeocystis_antarctica.AAC.4
MRCEPEHLDAAKDPPAVVGASKPLVRLHLLHAQPVVAKHGREHVEAVPVALLLVEALHRRKLWHRSVHQRRQPRTREHRADRHPNERASPAHAMEQAAARFLARALRVLVRALRRGARVVGSVRGGHERVGRERVHQVVPHRSTLVGNPKANEAAEADRNGCVRNHRRLAAGSRRARVVATPSVEVLAKAQVLNAASTLQSAAATLQKKPVTAAVQPPHPACLLPAPACARAFLHACVPACLCRSQVLCSRVSFQEFQARFSNGLPPFRVWIHRRGAGVTPPSVNRLLTTHSLYHSPTPPTHEVSPWLP